MLETSALVSLDGGQFTLSTQLIKPNYFEFLRIHWFTTDPAKENAFENLLLSVTSFSLIELQGR